MCGLSDRTLHLGLLGSVSLNHNNKNWCKQVLDQTETLGKQTTQLVGAEVLGKKQERMHRPGALWVPWLWARRRRWSARVHLEVGGWGSSEEVS